MGAVEESNLLNSTTRRKRNFSQIFERNSEIEDAGPLPKKSKIEALSNFWDSLAKEQLETSKLSEMIDDYVLTEEELDHYNSALLSRDDELMLSQLEDQDLF